MPTQDLPSPHSVNVLGCYETTPLGDTKQKLTSLVNRTVAKIERNDLDWINSCVEKSVFKGYGGPTNLGEILNLFVTWAQRWHLKILGFTSTVVWRFIAFCTVDIWR